MKVIHWCLLNNSGMGRTAQAMAAVETSQGLTSLVVDCQDATAWEPARDADVHVIHTHAPGFVIHGTTPRVWIAHGTPEVMFHSGYEQGLVNGAYGHGDAWMMAQFWLQHCEAVVTFWPRHQKIWQSLADRRTVVDCLPCGVNTNFWAPQPSNGHFAGTPAVLTAENCYEIKWPLDLFLAWPWVVEDGLWDARLHALYVPKDQHRWWFPLVNRNGCSFSAYLGPQIFDDVTLRNAFCSTDFYVGLVRYGDFNRIGLEAAATGAKVISYHGNPYASFWVDEGDQRRIALQLAAILKGTVAPRTPDPVPSMEDTATAMQAIYASL